MTLRDTFVVSLLLLTLAGCASFGTPAPDPTAPPQDPYTALVNFTRADLQAALLDAQGNNPQKFVDQAAINCYGTLLKYVGAGTVSQIQVPVGLFSLNQAKRDLLMAGGAQVSPIMRDLNLGCAAYFADERATLVKLGILGASIGVK